MLISKEMRFKEHLARMGGKVRHTKMDVTSDRIGSCVFVCVCVCVCVERI